MGRLPALTGIRGVAALAVFAFHAMFIFHGSGGAVSEAWWYTAHYGYLGVDLFFVLSGFLLALPFLADPSKLRSRGTWMSFVGRRIIRTAPAYYAAILLALVVGGKLSYLVEQPKAILLHLAYIPTSDPTTLGMVNLAFWSLAVEFQFYLIMPFLLAIMVRRPGATLAALGTLAFAFPFVLIQFAGVPGTWIAVQTPGYLFHFALGMGAAMLYQRGWSPPFRLSIAAPLALGLFVFLPNLLAIPPHGAWPALDDALAYSVWRSFPALGFAVIVFAAARASGLVKAALESKPAVHVGTISYSLYLSHFPVLLILPTLAPWTLRFGTTGFVLLAFAAAWPVALALYWIAEAPALAWKSRVGSRLPDVSRRTPTAAAHAHVDPEPVIVTGRRSPWPPVTAAANLDPTLVPQGDPTRH